MKYSRRKFIKTLGVGSAVLMLPSTPAFPKHIFKGDRKLGVALVGLGNYATHQLAPALQETFLCCLSGIVTGTPSKADIWKQQYNIPDENIYNYESFDNIADNKSIDIIYIVHPNSMHHEFVIRAAKAAIFCPSTLYTSNVTC